MSKRRNETGQMRREEYEAIEDDVSADSFEIGFQRASDESIRKRKIVKARVGNRPLAATPTAVAATKATTTKTNPFGGFQGLMTVQPPASSNPFAGFSGLTSTSQSIAESTSSTSRTVAAGSYQQAMEGLNKAFLAFVNGQAQKNLSASWVSSVQDYLKYADDLATKHASTKPVAINETKRAAPSLFSANPPSVPAGQSSKVPSSSDNASTPSGFSFNFATTTRNDPAKANKSSVNGSSTKNRELAEPSIKNKPDKSSFGGGSSSLFSSQSINLEIKSTPAFSFGSLPKPATATSSAPATGPLFGNLIASNSTTGNATGGFNFGALSSSTSNATPAVTGDEDEENIGREEATVIIKADSPDDECKFESEKTKIYEFKKDEKRWVDKGVHPLKVLVNKEMKSSRILVRNEIGKIVLNAALYKGIALRPHEVKGKKAGVTLALQTEDGELTQFLLKVNAARVDELIQALESAAG